MSWIFETERLPPGLSMTNACLRAKKGGWARLAPIPSRLLYRGSALRVRVQCLDADEARPGPARVRARACCATRVRYFFGGTAGVAATGCTALYAFTTSSVMTSCGSTYAAAWGCRYRTAESPFS